MSKRKRITKREVHDPDWYFRNPRTRKWLVQCPSCQQVGYKPNAPSKFFGSQHIFRYFQPLFLGTLGLCLECEKAGITVVKRGH